MVEMSSIFPLLRCTICQWRAAPKTDGYSSRMEGFNGSGEDPSLASASVLDGTSDDAVGVAGAAVVSVDALAAAGAAVAEPSEVLVSSGLELSLSAVPWRVSMSTSKFPRA